MRKNMCLRIVAGLLAMSSFNYAYAGDMGDQKQTTQSSWQGLYIGGQLGGAWSREDWQYTNPNFFNTLGSDLLGNNFSFSTRGFIGGGYAGLNYQMASPWLIGLEGSYSGVNLNSTQTSPFFSIDQYTSKLNDLGSLRGRLGYGFERWLPYVTGGWAFANTTLTLNAPVEVVQASTSMWNSGWIVGVGVDYRMTRKLSIGVSYDYSAVNVNNKSVNCPSCGTGVGFGTPVVDGKFNTQVVMARLGYLINQ